MAGSCRLRNINVKILSYNDSNIAPGNNCAREIIHANKFFNASGLDVRDVLAEIIEHLASIDYGNIQSE